MRIRPFYSINHGPTTSLYYTDPDGNRVELLVDNFATAGKGQAWMRSPGETVSKRRLTSLSSGHR